MIRTRVIPKDKVERIWSWIRPGIEEYQEKTPHYVGTTEEIFQLLTSPEGDELLVITAEGEYGGFVTFKVQELEGEVWGTMAMIYLTPAAQRVDALPEVCRQLEVVLRERGCHIMNYMTARKGFRRLAPKLGFSPRIIEWMKEL